MRFAWLSLLVLILFAAANFSLAAAPNSPTDTFPDVYPSASAATTGIGEQIAAKLRTVSPAFTTIFIRQDSGSSISNDVVNNCTTLLASRFPKSRVQIDRIINPPPTTAPTITLSGSEWWTGSGSQPSGSQPDHGEIIATLSGPTTATFRGNFTHKLWLSDFASFSNANPGFTWLVAKSNRLYPTPAEADQSARDDLARQLGADVKNRLQSLPNHRSSAEIYSQARDMLRGDIQLDDKFLQRFNGPHGTSWQEAILYNTQKPEFANLITYATASPGYFASSSDSSRKSIASMITLLIVIILLYSFLNWITKGYFTTRLRITLFAALFVIAALLLLGLFTFQRITYIPSVEQRVQMEADVHHQAIARKHELIARQRETSAQVQN